MEEMISITDAGKLLGISRPRLSKLIKEKSLPKTKRGGTYLVNRDEVTAMVKQLREEGRIRVGGTTQDTLMEAGLDESSLKESESFADLTSRVENLEKILEQNYQRKFEPRKPNKGSFFKSMFKPWG